MEKTLSEIKHPRQAAADSLAALHYVALVQNKAQGNLKLTLTIFNKLFEELPVQVRLIKETLEAKDYDICEEVVHKLNGSASFCDLENMRQAADALENCIFVQQFELASELLAVLETAVEDLLRLKSVILLILPMRTT